MKMNRNMGRRIGALLLSLLLFAALPTMSVAASFEDTAGNGQVRDGAVGDAPGVIGDENDDNPSGLTGDYPPTDEAPVVLGDTDEASDENALNAFLGVMAALVLAATILSLAYFLFPKKEDFGE